MIAHIVRIAAVLAASGALASLGYYSLCLWSALQFLRVKKRKRSCRVGFSTRFDP